MKYTLETKIQFSIALGRDSEEEIQTMEELGFTQEYLETKTDEEIERDILEMYEDWQANYLDAGWSVAED